jgi:hypothetical protein
MWSGSEKGELEKKLEKASEQSHRSGEARGVKHMARKKEDAGTAKAR